MRDELDEPHTTALSPRLMTVNVRLCGSIPRKDMINTATSDGAPCSLRNALSPSCFATFNGHPTHRKTAIYDGLARLVAHNNDNNIMKRGVLSENQPLGPVLEPPSWAVPARGETRLEPVCEAVGRQSDVDLSTKPCYRIGRSPNSDIQLFHATSSRRHAMIFHHSNGSCYIVDCGSAHGTFVNGVRISSPSNGGVVVPHRVRRGALIRFGGQGAPCFLLKSFAFSLKDVSESASPDMGELVRRNTRINALGRSASRSLHVQETIEKALVVFGKRPFDSVDCGVAFDEEPCGKRMRCSSPPLSPPEPLHLVSPDLPSTRAKPLRVTFSPAPPQLFYPALVTPEELSSGEEDDNDSI